MQTNEKKKRSKSAKIVLWCMVGCVAAILLAMAVWFIIAACGGTGTANGGKLGFGFDMLTTAFGVAIVVLIMTWMLTEPSFKKEEEVYIEVKPQYVKKSARPQPVKKVEVEEAKPVEEAPVEEAPVEEAPVEEAPVEETPAEEAPAEEAPVEEAPVEEAPAEEAPVEEAPVEEKAE